MPYGILRGGTPVIRIDRLPAQALHPADDPPSPAREILPAIDALRGIGADLAAEKLEAAWIGLDSAELELRCHDSHAIPPEPALGRALGAVERARESLAQARVGQASADIDQAIQLLSRM